MTIWGPNGLPCIAVTLIVADISMEKSIMSSSAWPNRFPQDHYFHDLLDREPFGLFFGNGGYWKESRKLVLRLLHQFDFFREEIMEKIAQFEARKLLEKELFRKIAGSRAATVVLPVHRVFLFYTLNVVFQVLHRKRILQEDPNLQRTLSAINSFNESFSLGMDLLDVFPWLIHVPFLRFHRNLVELNSFSRSTVR